MARLGWIGTVIALALLVGCEKKKLPQEPMPVNNNPAPKQDTPKVQAPATVPKSLETTFNAKWPEIEREGAAFASKFAEASAAKASGDREKLDKLIDEANGHYQKLADLWAEIAYGFDEDGPEAEACRRFLSPYERKVQKWQKQNKGLKEFSRAN